MVLCCFLSPGTLLLLENKEQETQKLKLAPSGQNMPHDF